MGAAITSPTIIQKNPNCAIKEIIVKCTATSNYTFDASGYFTTIYGIQVQSVAGVAVADCAFTLLSVDVGTIVGSNPHFIRIWGV
jgi:hypothetical protein